MKHSPPSSGSPFHCSSARSLLPVCVLLAVVPALAYAADPIVPPVAPDVPCHGFPWSRQRQQDKDGYYEQPLGLCEDYPQEDRSQAKLDQDFAVARSVGAKALRVGIPWESIERRRGRYDWDFWDRLVDTSVRSKVLLIPYVCYTPEWAASVHADFWRQPPTDPEQFGAFMRVIAARYRGKVRSWEIWNEPDNRDFWLGSVSQFAGLLRAGAQGVRAGAPGATVVLGGMADGDGAFFKGLLGQYGIGGDVDVLNIHGYFETWNAQTLENYPRYIESVAASASRLHPVPDIWLAEFGYSDLRPPAARPASGDVPVHYDYEHTAAYQASALFKSHILAAATGRLSLTAWYRIHDLMPLTNVIGDNHNRFLGVLDRNGRPKPALAALRLYSRLFGKPTRCLDKDVHIESAAGSEAILHVFAQKRGKVIVTGWLRSPHPGEAASASEGVPDTRVEEVSLTLPEGQWANLQTYALDGALVPSHAVLSANVLRHIVLTGARPFIATVVRQRPDSRWHIGDQQRR